jgi:hypothetical protein
MVKIKDECGKFDCLKDECWWLVFHFLRGFMGEEWWGLGIAPP